MCRMQARYICTLVLLLGFEILTTRCGARGFLLLGARLGGPSSCTSLFQACKATNMQSQQDTGLSLVCAQRTGAAHRGLCSLALQPAVGGVHEFMGMWDGTTTDECVLDVPCMQSANTDSFFMRLLLQADFHSPDAI